MDQSVGLLPGERQTGQKVRQQNVEAVMAVANVVRSSLGPTGLDKMLVDDIGEVVVTNDGATILKRLDVSHPAGKVIVQLSGLQDEEVGDGTTTVVLLAAELLRRGFDLVKQKHHPTTVITGFRIAQKRAVKYIQENLSTNTDKLGKEVLVNAAMTSLSSKLLGANSRFFATMAADAALGIKTVDAKGATECNINTINVLKSPGSSFTDSKLLEGFALNCTKASDAMPTRLTNVKIACLNMSLQKAKMAMSVQILVNDPSKLGDIAARENDITKERLEKVLNAGANLILTTKGMDDAATKYIVERGAIGVRRVALEDMRRIAMLTGGKVLLTLADLEGEESCDPASLGAAEEVREEEVGEQSFLFIRGTKSGVSSSIILRGPNNQALEEMERSFHDALCVVKRVLESSAIVPGGGAVESALSVHLETFAKSIGSREQMAIAEFAESLLVIPKTLAVNSSNDSIDCVARLRAAHSLAQQDPEKRMGLDLSTGKLQNSLEAGVVEPAMSKTKSISFATEAAITILRIDDLIKLEKQEDPREMER